MSLKHDFLRFIKTFAALRWLMRRHLVSQHDLLAGGLERARILILAVQK